MKDINLKSAKDCLIIQRGEYGLIPKEYYPTLKGKHDITGRGRTFAARKFIKHGPNVDLEKITDIILMDYTRQKKGLHVAFRQKAFDALKESKQYYFSGYTFTPIIDCKTGALIVGENAERRHVPLVECVQAALMQYYWRHSNAKVAIDITVNKSGRVIAAVINPKGTTTTNQRIRNIAIQKAKTLQLNAGNTDEQTGTLVFNFKLRN